MRVSSELIVRTAKTTAEMLSRSEQDIPLMCTPLVMPAEIPNVLRIRYLSLYTNRPQLRKVRQQHQVSQFHI
jgi:hypothetical protein